LYSAKQKASEENRGLFSFHLVFLDFFRKPSGKIFFFGKYNKYIRKTGGAEDYKKR